MCRLAGGTFFILLPAPALSTQPERPDSIVPQGRILKENLLVASQGGLQQLAGESLPIVASLTDSTTSRAIKRFQSIPDAFASGALSGVRRRGWIPSKALKPEEKIEWAGRKRGSSS